MLRILAKGYYLCFYEYWLKNLNAYPHTYSYENSFLFRKNSTIQFNHKKQKTKQDRYFDETNKKSGNYCK